MIEPIPATPPRTMYATYHRSCGHVIGVSNSRTLARQTVAAMFDQAAARHFRIRVATDEDIAATLRADRCAVCTVDGQVTV